MEAFYSRYSVNWYKWIVIINFIPFVRDVIKFPPCYTRIKIVITPDPLSCNLINTRKSIYKYSEEVRVVTFQCSKKIFTGKNLNWTFSTQPQTLKDADSSYRSIRKFKLNSQKWNEVASQLRSLTSLHSMPKTVYG